MLPRILAGPVGRAARGRRIRVKRQPPLAANESFMSKGNCESALMGCPGAPNEYDQFVIARLGIKKTPLKRGQIGRHHFTVRSRLTIERRTASVTASTPWKLSQYWPHFRSSCLTANAKHAINHRPSNCFLSAGDAFFQSWRAWSPSTPMVPAGARIGSNQEPEASGYRRVQDQF